MSDDASNIPPSPTPTGYQRTQGGGFKWVPPTPEQLAKLLPQYDIECLLGRGGMGAVYKGTQKSLGRPVAIKILPPEVDDEDTSYTARFKNEARIMARLSHPGIVAVFDFGETSDGQLYIVMEYIDGSDVAKMVLSQGKLPPEHALAITAHVCDALGYAHANGIIHRDIKPANILINMDGAVKVADFGLAKLDDPGTSGLTKSGMAMGTPDFVAPETLMLGTQADGRADLYAVGVMLYQMLTGQLPRGAFDLPSTISGTDRRFDAIVMKAMKYDRAERYQSSAEIRRDLDVILTAPLIESGGESSAAIPKQSLPQKPVAKGPQQKAGAAAPKQKADIGKQESKAPLFIGIAAALAIGAFVMFGGGKPDVARLSKVESATPQTATTPNLEVRATPAAPVKARDEPKPTPVVVGNAQKLEMPKPAQPKKEEPKPVAAALAPKIEQAADQTAAPVTDATPAPSLSVSATPGLPSELATLDAQLKQFTAERVTAPFEAEVAKLDVGYLGGLDRKIAEEKSAGHLDGVLAIEEEKKRLAAKQPIPSAGDDATSTTTPAVLKGLRQIYRDAYAKIEATRAANLKALTDPLTIRLKTLESDLTKKDRIADAKTVREYREKLESRSGGLQPSSPGSAPPVHTPAVGNTPLLAASKDGFTNSLGMKFVPVPGTDVLMCIHETRIGDYAKYAGEVPGVDERWTQVFKNSIPADQRDSHPVLAVSYDDAQSFCTWLIKKEGRSYRLPSDEEWSFAVGIGRKEKRTKNSTPQSLTNQVRDEFPWGGTYPPKTSDLAGNYSDATAKAQNPDVNVIEGYSDGFSGSAPVMSFKPNKLGIHDMGGNAFEWCIDWWNAEQKDRTVRGGSYALAGDGDLLSASRVQSAPATRATNTGFRIVVDLKAPSAKPPGGPGLPAPRPPPPPPTTGSAPKSDFTNSLGMKFIKISGTKVMFCIHETRYKDYAAYAAVAPDVNPRWKNQILKGIAPKDRTEDHPVVIVSWEDAQAFCVWLSQKEGKRYRLPTDEEWSYAVGIGRDEKRKKGDTPGTIAAVPNEYPWGTKWPPSKGCENYGDESYNAAISVPKYLTGYDDGYPTTAPVMSFKPNRYGLYDMGGNVSEWCEDWLNNTQTSRVLRGSSWKGGANDFELLSSARGQAATATREDQYGFRIVVEITE